MDSNKRQFLQYTNYVYLGGKGTVLTPHLYIAHIEIILLVTASLSVHLLATGDSENSWIGFH